MPDEGVHLHGFHGGLWHLPEEHGVDGVSLQDGIEQFRYPLNVPDEVALDKRQHQLVRLNLGNGFCDGQGVVVVLGGGRSGSQIWNNG